MLGDDGSVLESELKKNPVKALRNFVFATALRENLLKRDGENFESFERRSKVAESIFSKLTEEEKKKVINKMSSTELKILGMRKR